MRILQRLVVLAAAGILLGQGAAQARMEHDVKAAYLFKFLSYVEWPADSFAGSRDAFIIGILESDEVRASLADIVRNRVAQGRPVEVRRLANGETPEGVHALFVGRAATESITRFAGRSGLLIVGEADGALDRGAMINLLRVEDRVRFEVAPKTAEQSGLRISSRLLALAQAVRAAEL